jgi:hypothetical protein
MLIEALMFLSRPGEFAPLRLGQHAIWPPVGLAPMAGITNAPFRAICTAHGAPLCIRSAALL